MNTIENLTKRILKKVKDYSEFIYGYGDDRSKMEIDFNFENMNFNVNIYLDEVPFSGGCYVNLEKVLEMTLKDTEKEINSDSDYIIHLKNLCKVGSI